LVCKHCKALTYDRGSLRRFYLECSHPDVESHERKNGFTAGIDDSAQCPLVSLLPVPRALPDGGLLMQGTLW
jgi:hypothetical protein